MRQLAIDDLVKSPSGKLFPFIKLLLAENAGLAQAAAPSPGAAPTEAPSAQVSLW